jgi:hypothetical protein
VRGGGGWRQKKSSDYKMPHGVRSHSDYNIFKHKRFVDGLWGEGVLFLLADMFMGVKGFNPPPPLTHPPPPHPAYNTVRLCKVRERAWERGFGTHLERVR